MNATKTIGFVTMVVAVLAAAIIPLSSSDATHIGGEGHGTNELTGLKIDATYSYDKYSILWITLSEKPIDKVRIYLISGHDESQDVEMLPNAKSFNVFLKPLSEGTYRLGVQLQSTGLTLVECDLIIGQTCTVSFSAGAGEGTMNPSEVGVGTSYTLPQSTFDAPSGYHFKDWIFNNQHYSVGQKVTVNGDMEFLAYYEEGPASEGDDMTMVIIAAIVVVVLLLIIIFILMRRRRPTQ